MFKYWHSPLEKVVHPLVPPWKLDPSYAIDITALEMIMKLFRMIGKGTFNRIHIIVQINLVLLGNVVIANIVPSLWRNFIFIMMK